MLKEMLEHLEGLYSNRVQSAHGRAYAGTDLVPLPSPDTLAQSLEFHSLNGLVGYLASQLDGEASALIVDGPEQVRHIGALNDGWRQREVLALAKPYVSQGFKFGAYLDIEEFITSVQANFVQDEHIAAVLRVVGNITQEAVQTVADDGVSQSVTARAGIAKVANVVVPNPVVLRPFRTFPEVAQPPSKYVLRMKRREDALPTAALFEVHDCQWKHEAITNVEQALLKKLDTFSLKIPVFA